jgi:hypothetical protein
MGRREGGQGQFFYSFDLDKVVPPDHLVRQIDGVLDLGWKSDAFPRAIRIVRKSLCLTRLQTRIRRNRPSGRATMRRPICLGALREKFVR